MCHLRAYVFALRATNPNEGLFTRRPYARLMIVTMALKLSFPTKYKPVLRQLVTPSPTTVHSPLGCIWTSQYLSAGDFRRRQHRHQHLLQLWPAASVCYPQRFDQQHERGRWLGLSPGFMVPGRVPRHLRNWRFRSGHGMIRPYHGPL